ncbi:MULTISPECIES: hypothetical protein [Micromonosporaceae]|nr:hypothetical protein [Solwaraspora sp. WMMD937]WFE23587.1 hypothetical protein O7621_10115 [Solwaraspora sp. WMMD937]
MFDAPGGGDLPGEGLDGLVAEGECLVQFGLVLPDVGGGEQGVA